METLINKQRFKMVKVYYLGASGERSTLVKYVPFSLFQLRVERQHFEQVKDETIETGKILQK